MILLRPLNCLLSLVPALACGFDDLQQRVEAQSQQAAAHQERIKELKSRIQALSQKHELNNSARSQRIIALQTQLTQRVMRIVQHLHLLIPALRSSSIRAEEEALGVTLENIAEEIKRPGGLGKLKGKLNELWAIVGALNATRARDRKDNGSGWAVVDEEGLAQIAQVSIVRLPWLTSCLAEQFVADSGERAGRLGVRHESPPAGFEGPQRDRGQAKQGGELGCDARNLHAWGFCFLIPRFCCLYPYSPLFFVACIHNLHVECNPPHSADPSALALLDPSLRDSPSCLLTLHYLSRATPWSQSTGYSSWECLALAAASQVSMPSYSWRTEGMVFLMISG